MKASDRALAARYGRALFLAAEDKRESQRVQADLSASHRVLLDALPVLRHPRVPAAEKKKKLASALGGTVSPLTLRFLELLIEKKRFELLALVGTHFSRFVAERSNLAKAQVRTARPLSAQDQERLKKALEKFSGKNIELDVKEDPEVIGGLVVRLGDWVMDGSLRGRLRNLKEAFHGD